VTCRPIDTSPTNNKKQQQQHTHFVLSKNNKYNINCNTLVVLQHTSVILTGYGPELDLVYEEFSATTKSKYPFKSTYAFLF
jgi:hypothetical protein